MSKNTKKQMPIYKLSIPVDNYYGDGVFFQDFYFEGNHSPTKEEFLVYINSMQDNATEFSQTLSDFKKELLTSVNNIISFEKWPRLFHGLISTSVKTKIPKWGEQPITLELVEPIKLGENK